MCYIVVLAAAACSRLEQVRENEARHIDLLPTMALIEAYFQA